MDILPAVADLRAECASVDEFVSALDDDAWTRPTIFHGWTTYDEIAHNHHLDLLAVMSLESPEAFAGIVEETSRRSREEPDYSFRRYTNATLGRLSRAEVLTRWRGTYQELCALLNTRDPASRMAWFGPPMSIEACATARQMEVWAHAQDIYDLFRVKRLNSDRIRQVALLGVKTFGWSFANRKREIPATKPYVALTAPSGAVWEWNDSASSERIIGLAEDFCLVVTQRRHIDDTRLRVTGGSAREWMLIAQCFAGDPADHPPAGFRMVDYHDTNLIT